MSKLIRNTGIYTIGRVLPQITGFILLPVYTEYLPPAEYGIVESMLVLGAVLSIFFSMATERSIFRLYYDFTSEEEKKIFVGNISVLMLMFSTLILVLIFFSRDFIAQIYSSIEFMPYYIYAIANAYFMAFAFIPQTLFQVEEKAINFFAITMGAFFIGLGFILYYVVFLEQGAEGLLKGKMIGNFIMLPIYIYIIVKKSSFQIKKSVIKNILLFSLPMVPTLLTAWILNMSNRIFIEHYFTLEEVGIFSLAFKISGVTTILFGALYTAYNPLFYRLANHKDKVYAKDRIKGLNQAIIIFALIICFVISFFSKELINIFLDEKYVSAAGVIPLIVFSLLILQISGLYNLMIYQSKKSTTIMSISIVAAFASIVFNFLLIPKFGMYGAAWSSITSAIMIFILSHIYAKKNYYIKLPLKKVLVWITIASSIVFLDIYINLTNFYLLFAVKIILTALGFYFFYKREFKTLKLLIK
tara:strand:- start:14510 stop:15925 length:1416 start_codon:yes stop_codon:yes gene_type:complete